MLPSSPLLAPLTPLVERCQVVACNDCNGWPVDCWDIDGSTCDCLVTAFRQMLWVDDSHDPVLQAVHAEAQASGTDLSQLFLGEEHLANVTPGQRTQFERNTRADLTELASTASLLATQNVKMEDVFMPNIPKGSRTASEHGLDFVAINEGAFESASPNPQDTLYIGSVKHTLSSPRELCRDLVESVSEDTFNLTYLTSQIRVFAQHLRRPRVLAPLYFPNQGRLSVLAFAAFPPSQKQALEQQMTKQLPARNAPAPQLRQLCVEDLDKLHEWVSTPVAPAPTASKDSDEDEELIRELDETGGD